MTILTAAASLAETAPSAVTSCPPSAAETIQALQSALLNLRSKLLPDAVTQIDDFEYLTDMEQRLVGQIQVRTYVNLSAALERLVGDAVDE